jgi:hypothetical protein
VTYTPDPARYQQLKVGGATGPVDCTAHGGAWITDAHTQGRILLNGRQIRLASDEPVPDPGSPGLNVGQVDAAIYRITNGRVNLDTPDPRTVSRAEFKARVVDGRWANLAVKRSVLVDRGYGGGNGFRGAHDITIHARAIDNAPVIGDPLVAHYMPSTWDAVLDAAEAVTASGLLFVSYTRDLTPDYRVVVKPRPGYDKVSFVRYLLDDAGRIIARRRRYTFGFAGTCSVPKFHSGVSPITGRRLVQITSGLRKGWWVSANWAEEIIP